MRENSCLLQIPKLDLVKQFVLEPMHLVDGGVIKLFLDFILHAPQIKTGPNRLAAIAKHRMKPDQVYRLRVIIDVYSRLQVSFFPRRIR